MSRRGIQLCGVTKCYEDTVALAGIELAVAPGEIVGLLGPDGAGKTSAIRIVATVLEPDSGSVHVAGFDARTDYRQIRAHVGYVPGRFALYQDLTVRENLEFFATIFGTSVGQNIARIRDIYGQIEPFSDRPAGKLSGGMKQKLALSCALIHQPRVLLLDEPTTGVDPVSRREFWDMIEVLRESGMAVLVSTPYMDEAGRCDRVVLMNQGVVLAEGSPEKLASEFENPLYAIRSSNRSRLIAELRQWDTVVSAFPFGESIHVALNTHTSGLSSLDDVQSQLTASGYPDAVIELIDPGLEDRFMELLQVQSGPE